MPRYVILWHELPETHEVGAARESHWDLMLEWGDVLRTWALASEPTVGRRKRSPIIAAAISITKARFRATVAT
jgi:hypothetical protein